MGAHNGTSGPGNPPTYLYDPELLQRLDFSASPAKFTPPITAANPGESWLLVRPLAVDDYDKGFVKLLSQLTEVGTVSKEDFICRFAAMKAQGCYFVTVVEDTRCGEIIGAATLTTEMKFIHDCGVRSRLEDVVVNETYRGKQLGKLIVVTVSLLAKLIGCYKMSLDCKDKLIPFYKSLGYNLETGNSNTMNIRYNITPRGPESKAPS